MATKTKTVKSFPISKPTLTIEGLFNKPLSAIIRIAVKDLEKNVANGAEVSMGDWGRRNGECVGCLAGHCLFPYTKNVNYFMDSNQYAQAIALALDDVRNGYLINAVTYLYDNITPKDVTKLHWLRNKDFVKGFGTLEYDENPKLFSKSMLRIADGYEKIGF